MRFQNGCNKVAIEPRVVQFWSEAPSKRSQHCWAFGHPVVQCWDMLGVVGSNLTIFKLEPTFRNTAQRGGQYAICCVSMNYFYHLTSPFNWIRQSTQWNQQVVKIRHWPHFQTPRRELKIRRVAEYLWRTFRCLEMWSNTVWSVWYIF